jgi:hypothetical protein
MISANQGFSFSRTSMAACFLAHRKDDNRVVGMYKDTAMTIPATADGDLVAAWRDEVSGNGLYALQSNSAQRPTLKIVSGKPLLRFSAAANAYLEFPSIGPFAFTTGFEILIKLSGTVAFNVPDAEEWIFSKDTDTGRSYAFGYGGRFPDQINGNGDNLAIANSGPLLLGFRGDAVVNTFWRFAQVDYPANGWGAWGTPGVNATLPRIGNRAYPGYNQPFNGDLMALVIGPKVLADYQRAAIESYQTNL